MSDEHNHDWQRTDDTYACAGCTETTNPCNTCNRPLDTQLLTCDRCLDAARKIITDITDAITTTPFHCADPAGLKAARYDRVLVTSSTDTTRLPFGLDRIIEDPEDTRIEAAKHPNTALEVLEGWADMWAAERNETWSTVDGYLIDHTLWAAQNPTQSGWHDYLSEARRVRSTIRRLLGLNAEKGATPCVHCGGPITRAWLHDGLDDTHKCEQCGMSWPDEERLAVAAQRTINELKTTHPDMLVTIEEAKAALPDARRGTLDTWARRGIQKPDTAKFPIRGRNTRGTPVYRLGDIADAWHNRQPVVDELLTTTGQIGA